EARREPARQSLEARRGGASGANAERDRAAAALAEAAESYEAAHREIEGLEADVEAARSEVFSAINSATALRHALEHAAAARDKVAETLSKLDVESGDVRVESERVSQARQIAADGLKRAQDAIEATRIAKTARESELASARIEHEWRARSVRSREHELAGLEARLKSLEELEAARAGYGDAPRAVLAQANGKVNQHGSIADYLDVDPGYERAVEACLGDLLQHVVVEQPEHAAAGFQIVRESGAGRCGFLITSAVAPTDVVSGSSRTAPDGVVALSSVMRVNGPWAEAITRMVGDAWIADSYGRAVDASRLTPFAVATLDGEVFHGPAIVSGGARGESRGILETKREIKELRDRISGERNALFRLAQETAELEATIAHAGNAIAALNAEHHKQEKAIVAFEAQLQHASNEENRLSLRTEQLVRERR
ncbi:MAG TPA: hypothetical protein VFF43_12160, partial [Caldimonas sp.]|nr:hypothetical protein [Caldimonas sp.]